jgi:hypothetical protein
MRCYFQTDPRGCSLYLIDPGVIPGERAALLDYQHEKPPTQASMADLQSRWIDSNYNRGHAVGRLGR